jgi:hypothetical protein
MNPKRLLLFIPFLIIMFNCNIIFAQKSNKRKSLTCDSTITKSTTEYTIDGKSVSKEEFEKFLSGLKELSGTWYCAETSTGGITGYNAADKKNVIYEYKTTSDSGKSINAIRRKNILK